MSATKALRAPSKIASKLDWKKASGAILALDVGQDKIGLAIASHPSYGEAPLALEPVPLTLETRTSTTSNKKNKKQQQIQRRVLSEAVREQIEEIVKAHNVSSFVVSWPVQREGRCGAACGKVLHTLDSLVEEDSSTSVINANRPFCLWDEHHTVAPEDEWGRNPIYGEPCSDSTKTVHVASQEQYYVNESGSDVAVNVMKDFIRAQWPEINVEEVAAASQQQQQQHQPSYYNNDDDAVDVEWLEHYEDTEAYMSVAV